MTTRVRMAGCCNRYQSTRRGLKAGRGAVRLLPVVLVLGMATAAGPVMAAVGSSAPGTERQLFVAYQTVSTPALDEALAAEGFPEVPDAVWAIGTSRQRPPGNPSSPWRAGTFGSLGVAEAEGTQKRVRLVQGYLGPRLAYHAEPTRWLSAEAGIGVAVGVSAMTLVHRDFYKLEDALNDGRESTIWRLSVALVPEVAVGLEVHPRLGLQLGASYFYDTGLAGGWRAATGAALPDAPAERLSGLRYWLSLVWRPGAAAQQDRLRQQPPPPPRAFLGVMAASLDVATASRLRLNDTRGALVVRVLPGSPAHRAGLRRDDVIRRFGSVEILSAAHLTQEVQRYRPGDWVYVQVWRVETRFLLFRRGQLVDMMVQLGEEPQGW